MDTWTLLTPTRPTATTPSRVSCTSVSTRLDVDTIALQRALAIAPGMLGTTVDLGSSATLDAGPFVDVESRSVPSWVPQSPRWTSRARVHTRAFPFARSVRVEIELTLCSASACEIRVRATGHRAVRWSARRPRDWFRVAWATTDAVADAVARVVVSNRPLAERRICTSARHG